MLQSYLQWPVVGTQTILKNILKEFGLYVMYY